MKKLLLMGALLLIVCGAYAGDYQETENLLSTSRTIIGEPLYYPGGGAADITSMVVVMQPGEKTAIHKHGVPLYAYILSGELEVDYGPHGKKTYREGDSFMEAMDQFHQGENIGPGTVRILTVFMGGNGQPLVVNKSAK